jgi:prepilin-type N-terminal cleavage/methylation domain-containing protein
MRMSRSRGPHVRPGWHQERPAAARWLARSGFTLIEVLLSATLMAMILVSAYLCLHAAICSQRLIEPRIDVLQNARVAMALMTADLRSACPACRDFDFLGTHRSLGDADADSLDFATHHYTPHRAREGDFCLVSFFLDRDPESGRMSLFRRRNPTIAPEPLVGGYREEIATGVRGLRFEYSDGLDWYDSWGEIQGQGKKQTSLRYRGNLVGMPEAVRITLWLDCPGGPTQTAQLPGSDTSTNELPMVFQTVARLNLAANASSTSGSAASSGSDTGAGSQNPSGVPNAGGNR